MAKEIGLHPLLPIAEIEDLQAGDRVLFNGIIYTARDAAHQRLVSLLEAGANLPFDIRGQVLYYTGPSPTPPGKVIGSAGPTTSCRMDPYTPKLLDAGLKGIIGKGPRCQSVINSMIKNRAVYFVAIGGAGAVIARSIREVKIIAYPELGPEAIRALRVENFPALVAIDAKGNDLFKIEPQKYLVCE
jgi:fumarate hydratase subunit beta